jgi:hypothetical protein
VLSHSVSESTVSELRKVQTEKDYGELEWSQDGTILAYSRGGIFVAAYDFETEDHIALGVSRSSMTFRESGEVKRFVSYQKPKTSDEFRELDRKIREAMAGRTNTYRTSESRAMRVFQSPVRSSVLPER